MILAASGIFGERLEMYPLALALTAFVKSGVEISPALNVCHVRRRYIKFCRTALPEVRSMKKGVRSLIPAGQTSQAASYMKGV